MILTGKQVKYRGTVTGLKISAVDGTAFIDNAGATIPTYADGNHSIEIYDSGNRMLRGVLKAAGTSETLDTNIFASFDFTSGWVGIIAAINDADTFTNTGSTGSVLKSGAVSIGNLYKTALSATPSAGTARIAGSSSSPIYCLSGESNKYATAVNSTIVVSNITGGIGATTDVISIVMQKVLTPSATGATIVSAKGGTTYNFAYKGTSFTYNAASYYCIVSKVR